MSFKKSVSKQTRQNRPVTSFSVRALVMLFFTLTIFCLTVMPAAVVCAKTVTIDILMAHDLRLEPVNGLKEGLEEHAGEEEITFIYKLKNAEGDRKKLPDLAKKIIAGKPDIAVAGGGIEADALLAASKGTDIPVIFLSVSSAVDRGIVQSLVSSGNNFTGIETNDTQLTAKRLWFIRKMMPAAKKIFCFHVPSIVPSVKSLAVARQISSELGFNLQVVEVESETDIRQAAASLSGANTDVILQLPVAPVDKALKSVVFPRAFAEKIPIFGYGMSSIKSGAVFSYAGSRYANGRQAARLVHKIVNGIKPADIPVETPEKLELVINRDLAGKLGLKLSSRVWRMADQIVDLQF